ncbi:kelch-like protein 10 isoform X1 [Brienomyrus brachyistius]|uniref:kelch-like protein 10 isoform X1 n=1 Tax=Brienomyrus brachyistius TaxID=42636 RepID=UPI0020B3001A|nr:kelch-like protein 10 isoform X1 [Brienomyrus brachyistius]
MMAHDMERVLMSPAFEVFNKLRLAGQLCDVVLITDGVKFNAHRVILCGCSSYFQALFTGDWKDSGKREYQFPGISPDTMQHIIEYAYTYSVLVTAENVANLLAAADRLSILGIIQRCSDFLHEQLCLQNCIGLFKTADGYGLNELHQSVFSFILQNFKEVASISEEFIDLSLQELCDIIEKDELNVKQEDVVFEAILRWIEHEPATREAHISALLPKVRMARMDVEYFLTTIKNNPIVKANGECKTIVSEVLKILYDLDNENQNSDLENPLICPRLPSDIILAIGGWDNSATNSIDAYDTRADCWMDVTQRDDSFQAGHGTAYLKGLVYCIGGSDGNTITNAVRRLDPITRTWQQVAPMHLPRCYHSVAVNDGSIYVMGGYDGQRVFNIVERYDPETNKWTLMEPMNERRSVASATTLNGKIYICGGFNGTDILRTAERYDPRTGEWTQIAPMRTRRRCLGVAAYKGEIYVVGGTDGAHPLRSMEVYDPATYRWRTMAPMFTMRSNFGIAVVDDLLFVMGGTDGLTVTNKVECYDADTGSWYRAQDMSNPKKSFSCCVIPAFHRIVNSAAPR